MWVQPLSREDSPGEGNGKPLQDSCLGNVTDRGAWRATVYEVMKESDTTGRLNNKTDPLHSRIDAGFTEELPDGPGRYPKPWTGKNAPPTLPSSVHLAPHPLPLPHCFYFSLDSERTAGWKQRIRKKNKWRQPKRIQRQICGCPPAAPKSKPQKSVSEKDEFNKTQTHWSGRSGSRALPQSLSALTTFILTFSAPPTKRPIHLLG